MKKLLVTLTSLAVLAQSSYSFATTKGDASFLISSKQIKCDDRKTVTIKTSYSLNNSSGAQDVLTISSNNNPTTAVFKRSQDHRQLADDQRAIQQKIDTAANVVSVVLIAAVVDVVAASAVEHFIIKGLNYPPIYEKILVALGKNSKVGYKANLGQILSKQEITFWGLAPAALVVGYATTHSLYSDYLEAQANQFQEKLCAGDYRSIENDNWDQ